MSGYERRASFAAVHAAVPGPLAAVLVELVPWEAVAVKLAHAPAPARSAARAGWAQLLNTASMYQHHVRQDLEPPALPAGATAAWLDTTEAGKVAGVTARAVRTWCRAGVVVSRDEHGRLLVEPGSLAEHIARRAEGRDFPDAEAGNLAAA
ncbi:hypothetical protein NJC10_00260 [Micrococcus sp. M4NT]|nr:hypothetical protein [Micrococcus sp. M4NT]